MQEDDFVLVMGAYDGTGTSAFGSADGSAGGYTKIDGNQLNSFSHYAGYKFMGATPDSNIDVGDFAANSTANAAVVIAVFRGVNTTTPLDTTATGTSGTSTTINFSSITTVTDGAVVVAFSSTEQNNSLGASTGYTFIDDATALNAGGSAGACYKTISTAGSETPSSISVTTTNYKTISIALRPA